MRELVYYVGVSLDGYIAGPDGEFDAFPLGADQPPPRNERYADAIPTDMASQLGIPQRNDMFDTVVMGWNTYAIGPENGMDSPYHHLRQIVFSRRHTADGHNLTVTSQDPVAVVRELKAENGAAIWLCGGSSLASSLIDDIDRLVLKRYPVLFGDGKPLFEPSTYKPHEFTQVRNEIMGSKVIVSEYVRQT